MNIAIGSDHAGYIYKKEIINVYKTNNIIKDFGTFSKYKSVDYPDFIHPVADFVSKNIFTFGIILCSTGNGVAMTANKHRNIRAALCWRSDISRLARCHNNANICCIPASFISLEATIDIIDIFLKSKFEFGRHTKRVYKIEFYNNNCHENKNRK